MEGPAPKCELGVIREGVCYVQNIQGWKTEKTYFRAASKLVRVKHLYSRRFILEGNEQ